MNSETIGITMMITAIVFAFVELPFGFCRDRSGNATLVWWSVFLTFGLGGLLISTVMP